MPLVNRPALLQALQKVPGGIGAAPASAKRFVDLLGTETQAATNNAIAATHRGSAALSGGTKTVSATWVTANSRIVATPVGSGTGVLYIDSIVAGASFDIKSSDGSDGRTVHWISIDE